MKKINSLVSKGMQKTELAFIDETGNFGFNFKKQGVSSHFIMTAILIGGEDRGLLEQGVEEIAQKDFSGGEKPRVKGESIKNLLSWNSTSSL